MAKAQEKVGGSTDIIALRSEVDRLLALYNSDTSNTSTIAQLTDSYNLLCKSYLYQGQPQEAVDILQEALKLPKNKKTPLVELNLTGAYSNLGQRYFAKGEYEAAISLYKAAIELPRNVNTSLTVDNLRAAYCELGNEYFRKGEYQKAIDAFKEGLKLPENENNYVLQQNLTHAYFELGESYFNQGEYKKAIAAYKEALKLPENPNTYTVQQNLTSAYNQLGNEYRGKHEYQEAIDMFKKALELPENDNTYKVQQSLAAAYTYLGAHYFGEGKYKESTATFKEALKLPENFNTPGIKKNLAITYNKLLSQETTISRDKYEEVLDIIEEALATGELVEMTDAAISRIQELHRCIGSSWSERVESIDVKRVQSVLSKVVIEGEIGATYKKILVDYHSKCGKNLAKALVDSCDKGKYSKIGSHIAILEKAKNVHTDSLDIGLINKQLSYLHLYLAKHSGDVSYLDKVDDSLFLGEELVEVTKLKAEIYFEKAKHCKHEESFKEALEYLEISKKLDPSIDHSIDFGKSFYIAAARSLHESDPEFALDCFKRAKELAKGLDVDLMQDQANKDLAYNIMLSLAKLHMKTDTASSIKTAIACLSEAEKGKKSIDTVKLKMECYLKLAYGDKQDTSLNKAAELLPHLQEAPEQLEMYAVKICARYLRAANSKDTDPDTASSIKAKIKEVIKVIRDTTHNDNIADSLQELCKEQEDIRFTAVCEKAKMIVSLPQTEYQDVAAELLSFVPQDRFACWSQAQGSAALTQVKEKSAESLAHEQWQAHKRFLKLMDEGEKNFLAKEDDRSYQNKLTWDIKGVTYKWEGYTSYEDRATAVYQITPTLFAMIDPALKTKYASKFTASLQQGVASREFGTKGIKEIGDGGFELKILGSDGAGDARLVASKVYVCNRDKDGTEEVAVTSASASPLSTGSAPSAKSSPKKLAKTPPKSPPPGSDTSSSGDETLPSTIKLIVFDTLTDHAGIKHGTGLNPLTPTMILGDNGWEVGE